MPLPNHSSAKEIGALLIQSLRARRSLGVDKDLEAYLTQSRTFFMEQWTRLAPDTTAIDGESILALAFHASPAAALTWARLAGEAAWIPSEHHPHPLVDLLPKSGRYIRISNPISWPRSTPDEAKSLAQFLQEGMRLAMPARAIENSPDAESMKAQQELGRFCAQDCSLFTAKQKAGWLLEHEGAVVLERGDLNLWIGQDLAGPNEPVWLKREVGMTISSYPYVRTTMLDAWLQGNAGPNKQATLEWLRRRGEPQETLDRVSAAELAHTARTSQSWKMVHDLVLEFEDGWCFQENESAPLAWQSILIRHPDSLKDMARQVGVRNLKMQANNGLGIWDCLAMAMAGEETINSWPTPEDIQLLNQKVPFSLAPQGSGYPLIFRARQLPPWREEWLDETIAQEPMAWLGPLDTQAKSAAQLLWTLQVGENVSNPVQRERAGRQIQLLHRAWKKAPEHVSSSTVAVLHGIQHYLNQYSLPLKDDLWELMGDTFPEPQADELDWVSRLLEDIQASKRKPRASRQALERTLTWLHMHTLPEPTTSKRSPRF